jgi:hypothetical protein
MSNLLRKTDKIRKTKFSDSQVLFLLIEENKININMLFQGWI